MDSAVCWKPLRAFGTASTVKIQRIGQSAGNHRNLLVSEYTTVGGSSMHSKLKGDIAESGITHSLMKVGCNVFKELGDKSKIDIVAEFEGKLIRIQCKGITPKNNAIQLILKKSGPNYQFKYTIEMFDFFAVYNLDTKEVALISSTILSENSTQVNLRIEEPKTIRKKKSDFLRIIQT